MMNDTISIQIGAAVEALAGNVGIARGTQGRVTAVHADGGVRVKIMSRFSHGHVNFKAGCFRVIARCEVEPRAAS